MISAARARAEDYLLMAQVGETIATQIAMRTDALRGSYCEFKSGLLGFKPQVPYLISYVRVSIL